MDPNTNDLLNNLGKDVWLHILGFLDTSSLIQMSSTCTTWNKFISNAETIWMDIYKRHRMTKLPIVQRDEKSNYRSLLRFWLLREVENETVQKLVNNKYESSLPNNLDNTHVKNWKQETVARLFREKLYSLDPQYYYFQDGVYPKHLFDLEWSSSSNGQCILCKYLIMADTLRFGLTFKGKQSVKWCHASCLIWKRINQPEEEYVMREQSSRRHDESDTRNLIIAVNFVGDMELETIDQITKWIMKRCPVEETPPVLGINPPFAVKSIKKKKSTEKKAPKTNKRARKK